MKTALFAWELGYGLGHVMKLRRIARLLKSHGIRTIGILKDTSMSALIRGEFDEIAAAPRWPVDEQVNESVRGSTATLNDILSSAGLADRTAVQRILSCWEDVIRRMRPDIMVADFAPLAGLAARGRVPLVHTGNGYTLPPPEMMRFPPLHRRSPPVWNEELTLETVNAAAASTGLRRIERLPQLFYGEACLVQTFPLLDPYDTQRTADLDGPIFDQPPTARVTGSQSIFVYWSAGRVPHASILDALMPVAERLRIFAPQWSQSALQSLAARGAQVQPAPKPLSGILGTSSVVVHNGGSGVAAEALAAGVPQIVLSTHIEQRLTGEVLERAGLAKLIRIHQLTTTRLEQALTPDDEMTAKAAEIGVQCRDLLASKDALRNCEKICLGLIGQG